MSDSRLLDAFAAFGEDLNMTRAARRLHVTQPALHAQLRRLGDLMGAPLYARVGRTLRLTPTGKRVLAFAREARERDAAFLGEIATAAPRQPVVLAAGEGAYLYLLGEPLRRAKKTPLRLLLRYPQ